MDPYSCGNLLNLLALGSSDVPHPFGATRMILDLDLDPDMYRPSLRCSAGRWSPCGATRRRRGRAGCARPSLWWTSAMRPDPRSGVGVCPDSVVCVSWSHNSVPTPIQISQRLAKVLVRSSRLSEFLYPQHLDTQAGPHSQVHTPRSVNQPCIFHTSTQSILQTFTPSHLQVIVNMPKVIMVGTAMLL